MTAEARRDEALKALQKEIDDEEFPPSSSTSYHSWVRGNCTLASSPSSSSSPDNNNNNELSSSSSSYYPTDRCRFFDKHGFIYLPQFCTNDEVQSMKSSMEEMVNKNWEPSSSTKTQVFRTDQKQVEAQGRSDYFLDSASKTHFFAEKDAIHEDTGELKEEYLGLGRQQQNNNNKLAALNKVGHGMHTTPGSPFRTYTQSPKIATLLRELGWVDPVVPQSMYIFKQARIGGEVTSHQDSTFLYTTPRQTCVGLWLALDDATLDNGCLWIRPKSHRESVRRQFVRNVEHFGKSLNYHDVNDDDEGKGGDCSKPQMTFRNLRNDDDEEQQHVTWEGALPKDSLPTPECVGLHRAGFVPVPCKAGDLLAFVGELDHLSLPNFSDKPRHTFQLHCVEGEGAGVEWSKENWLQYPPGVPFMKL